MNLKEFLTLTFFFLLTPSYADVISITGITQISESGIKIKIEPADDKDDRMMSFVAEYPDKSQAGMELKIVEGEWRAVFEKPNKLWVYDGDGVIHLSERTREPNGSKASSSTKVPALLKQAPKEIRDLIPK